jgi:hypothetical protein
VDEHRANLRSVGRSANAEAIPAALDSKTDALVRIGALIAIGAAPCAYEDAVRSARTQGASVTEVVDTLIAVSATVGTARVVLASDALSSALGYDIDAELEGQARGAARTDWKDSSR